MATPWTPHGTKEVLHCGDCDRVSYKPNSDGFCPHCAFGQLAETEICLGCWELQAKCDCECPCEGKGTLYDADGEPMSGCPVHAEPAKV